MQMIGRIWEILWSLKQARSESKEGSFVIAEEREDGILIRPAEMLPVEIYTPERKAEFLLSNSLDAEDYAENVKRVREMGLDPEKIDHYKPPGVQ